MANITVEQVELLEDSGRLKALVELKIGNTIFYNFRVEKYGRNLTVSPPVFEVKEGGRKKNKPLIVFPPELNEEIKGTVLEVYRGKVSQLDEGISTTTAATISAKPEAKSTEVIKEVPQAEEASSEKVEVTSPEDDSSNADIPKLPKTPPSPTPVVGDIIKFEHLSGQFIVLDTIDPSMLTLQASTGVTLKAGKKSRFQIVGHTDVVDT